MWEMEMERKTGRQEMEGKAEQDKDGNQMDSKWTYITGTRVALTALFLTPTFQAYQHQVIVIV